MGDFQRLAEIPRVTHSVRSGFGIGVSVFFSFVGWKMYALVEKGSADDFRRKHLNNSFTPMPSGVGVKEVFAELFTKSDRTPFSARM